MRNLLFCFIALVSVYALLPTEEGERTFEPEVPQIYLHNLPYNNNNETILKYFPKAIPSHLTHTELIALAYADQLVGSATYIVKDSYVTGHNGIRHVYLRQTANGLEILNGDLNINIHNKEVLSVGSSFYKGIVAEPKPVLSSLEALHSLGQHLGDAFEIEDLTLLQEAQGKKQKHTLSGYPNAVSDVKAELAYMQVDNGQNLELVWAYEIDVYNHWWNAMVSTETGNVIALFDWVDHANFNVYPIGINDPIDNGGSGRVNTQNPANSNGSRLAWNDQGNSRTFIQTVGNNVYAQENWAGGSSWQNNYRPSGQSSLNFNFPINLNTQPDAYIDSATTNLFYWNNVIHDIFYQYGFNEVSGNFQENNFGNGGLGNDAVQANAQDGAGYNNANFATPPDGQRPRMRMYVWNRSSPMRDGDLDNGIIIHEYGHGISNRLTGGPSNVGCLSTPEAGGMGEGWGDWWATALRQRASYTRTTPFPMGAYSNLAGIRKYPYTTNTAVNPETYSYISRAGYEGVHAKGEVWATILWEVYWDMVDDVELGGFNPNWYQQSSQQGNIKIFKNIVDGLKLQPCRPTFITARDAIIQADQKNYAGKHYCILWQAFAKRGLGVNAAAGGRTDNWDVPDQCEFK